MVAAQVKFLADGVLSKSWLPSPLPVTPWQNLQAMGLAFSWNSFSADFKFLSLSGRGFFKLKKFFGAVGVFLVCGHLSANDKVERLINIVEKRISLTTIEVFFEVSILFILLALLGQLAKIQNNLSWIFIFLLFKLFYRAENPIEITPKFVLYFFIDSFVFIIAFRSQ
jgi:hypothetical protein